MTRRVEFSPEALADLLNLYDYIAERSGAERALMFVQRIETYCRSFATFPEEERVGMTFDWGFAS